MWQLKVLPLVVATMRHSWLCVVGEGRRSFASTPNRRSAEIFDEMQRRIGWNDLLFLDVEVFQSHEYIMGDTETSFYAEWAD